MEDFSALQAKVEDFSALQAKVEKLMTRTPKPLPSNVITTDNFVATAQSDTSISNLWSQSGKVGSAVTTWMNDPQNQTTLKGMVQQGAGGVSQPEFKALQASVQTLVSSAAAGAPAASSGSGSGLTFNAAQEVGCVRWNWFHNKNTNTCYAMACDPQKTDYPNGTCLAERSSCTGTITPVHVKDGTCHASMTEDCTGSDCHATCPAGDGAIIMPTQCAGPLILQDIYMPGKGATSAPTPVLQGGAFTDLTVTNNLTVGSNLTVEKVLTVGNQVGDTNGGSTTGTLIVNGDASLNCPSCCTQQTGCPLTHPYAYNLDNKTGSGCCAKPATGGTTKQNPNTCDALDSIACPAGSGCKPLQVLDKNACPGCENCAKLELGALQIDSTILGNPQTQGLTVVGDVAIQGGDLHLSVGRGNHGANITAAYGGATPYTLTSSGNITADNITAANDLVAQSEVKTNLISPHSAGNISLGSATVSTLDVSGSATVAGKVDVKGGLDVQGGNLMVGGGLWSMAGDISNVRFPCNAGLNTTLRVGNHYMECYTGAAP